MRELGSRPSFVLVESALGQRGQRLQDVRGALVGQVDTLLLPVRVPRPHPRRDPRALPDQDGKLGVGLLQVDVVLRDEVPDAGGGRGLLAEVEADFAQARGRGQAEGVRGHPIIPLIVLSLFPCPSSRPCTVVDDSGLFVDFIQGARCQLHA